MGTKRLIAAVVGAATLAWLAMGATPAAARQTETTTTPSASGASEAGKKWHFTIPLGAWPFSIHGPTGARGFETDVDMSIHDVQKLKDRALGFAFEAGRGKVTGLATGYYLRFQTDPVWATLPNGVAINANGRLKWYTAELAGAYRAAVVDPGPQMFVFEPLAGVRYTKMESSIEVKVPADTSLAKRSVDWVDGFVGFRAVKSFTRHIGLSFRGDIGTGGSNHTWNASGALGYTFFFSGSSLTVAGGYKGMGLDYDTGGADRFFIDQKMYGPTLGVAYSF